MDSLARLVAFFALGAAVALTAPAAADYEGADGYATPTGSGFDVSHDGYQRAGQTGATPDPTTYVVIEAEGGTTEVVDGETVNVVQEPEPLAATEQAPPNTIASPMRVGRSKSLRANLTRIPPSRI